MKLKYGKLKIILGTECRISIGKQGQKRTEIKASCDCGVVRYFDLNRLKSGGVTSCGCSHFAKITTHGGSYTGAYSSWKAMVQRCTNKNVKYFYQYGGRDITICNRWKSFENFLYDMGERPEGMSLDRINTQKGYLKSNCRWATKKEQQNNRRTNVIIYFNNKKYTKAQLCEKYHIHMSTFDKRIKNKWSLQKALITPVNKIYASKGK